MSESTETLEPVVEETLPGGDPLDEISDEVVRAEAKKHRAIARRLEKKEETPAPVLPETPKPEFLTKADFHKANERKAVRDATSDPEVKANWTEIIPFYTPRRGKDTPEDIREDINDAITLYNARHKTSIKDDSADVLSTTPVVKAGGGGTEKPSEKPKDPPNFRLPVQPKDWYGKKL